MNEWGKIGVIEALYRRNSNSVQWVYEYTATRIYSWNRSEALCSLLTRENWGTPELGSVIQENNIEDYKKLGIYLIL